MWHLCEKFPLDNRTGVLYAMDMTRLFCEGLPLQVTQNSRSQPAIFTVNGQRFVVERIVQEWEIDTDWWTEQGRSWTRHFALVTRDNEAGPGVFCVVVADMLREEWRMERVYD